MKPPYIAVFMLFLSACSTTPEVVLDRCSPPPDLPAEKHMALLPEDPVLFEDFYRMFAEERARHAQDIEEYNSLYALCVTRTER